MCGIYACSSIGKNSSVDQIYEGLRKLQHRGQDGYGIASSTFYSRKFGKIPDTSYPSSTSSMMIGHVRYTTSGSGDNEDELQPLKKGNMYLAHNGNIPQSSNSSGHDTSYLMSLIDPDNIKQSLIDIVTLIPCAYCFVLLTPDAIYVVRDRHGIRPLYYRITDDTIDIASETCCWDDTDNVYEVKAGSVSYVVKNTITRVYQHPNTTESLCAMELLYFMKDMSEYKNVPIYKIREQLGYILASPDRSGSESDYVVVGVPRSGVAAARGYASALNLCYEQLITLVNNDRSFITAEKHRQKVCHKKFNYSDDILGKKIIVIDDTIVRGNVIREIVKQLWHFGAKEIHVRIPAPPVIDINNYGIAIKNKEKLLMNRFNTKTVCEYLGINSIRFLTVDDLKQNKYFPEQSYMHIFGISFEA